MNYSETASQILEAVGGENNVKSLTHCITRLRFILKDDTIPDTDKIKTIDGVMGVAKQGGQYQVIIGKEVDDVYQEVLKLTGDLSKDTEEAPVEEEKKLWEALTSTISGIFAPILGVLTACGVLKGLLGICTGLGFLTGKEGVYIVLYAIADSIFYFFPVIIGASAAEKFKLNKFVGMLIGAAMMYPTIITASESSFTFLHIPMQLANYSSTIFPTIIAVYAASKLNKISTKICPKTIAFFGAPFITMTVTVVLSLFIIGPVVNTISGILAKALTAVYTFSPAVCALLLGGPWVVLVMLGLHWAFIPLFIMEISQVGSCSIMGLLTANQFAMAGALLAIAAKCRSNKQRSSLAVSTGITCLFGVSEPGIYGLLLPLRKPFIMSIIAGSLGAVPAGLFHEKIYAFGASGLFQIPNGINPAGIDQGFYGMIISIVLGFILGFILTYFFGIPKEEEL